MMILDENASLRISTVISELEGIISYLEERYKSMRDRLLFENDRTKKEYYKKELQIIRYLAKTTMIVQQSLALMYNEQKINAKVLAELERMIKSIIPELYIELRELESTATKAKDEAEKLLAELTSPRTKVREF